MRMRGAAVPWLYPHVLTALDALLARVAAVAPCGSGAEVLPAIVVRGVPFWVTPHLLPDQAVGLHVRVPAVQLQGSTTRPREVVTHSTRHSGTCTRWLCYGRSRLLTHRGKFCRQLYDVETAAALAGAVVGVFVGVHPHREVVAIEQCADTGN